MTLDNCWEEPLTKQKLENIEQKKQEAEIRTLTLSPADSERNSKKYFQKASTKNDVCRKLNTCCVIRNVKKVRKKEVTTLTRVYNSHLCKKTLSESWKELNRKIRR